MKKIIVGSLLLILILVLSGCNKTKIEPVDKEFSRLESIIPSEFKSDYELPDATGTFILEYYLEDIKLDDKFLDYELLPNDKNHILKLIITDLDVEKTYYISITQIGYNNLDNDDLFNAMLVEIEDYIPESLISNISLPVLTIDFIDVNFNVDCSDIVRNRIVYIPSSETLQCNLSVKGSFDDGFREGTIPFQMKSLDQLPKLPAIYINTENNAPIITKEDYVPGTLTLEIEGESDFSEITDVQMKIKLRGNSTLTMPKKPYKIKFEDEQALLSDYAEKKWVLLANHVDQTLIRNYLAYSMSSKLDLNFTPSFTLVDVYINGEYQGNYLLTDQIEVSENRVNIEENTSDINTGFLIEYDIGLYRVGLENTDDNYFLIDEIPFVIKSPDFEDDHYIEDQKIFIEDYFNVVLNTLKNKEDYSNLINEATFIDWFIVNEVFKNVDSGYSSVYFHMDKDGLLEMGPVWDFDISSGVPGYVSEDLRGPTGWWTARSDKNVFFYYLMEYPTFRHNLKARWNEVYEDSIVTVLDEILEISDSITQSRYNNFELWDIIGKEVDWYTSPEVFELKTYDDQVWFLYDYLKIRIEWLNAEINDLS